MPRLPVLMDELMHERLRRLAFITKVAMTEHGRRALEKYLDDEEKRLNLEPLPKRDGEHG